MTKLDLKETVGAVSSRLLLKDPDTVTPTEQTQEQLGDYERSIIECIDKHKRIYSTDFYVVVITKKERLMPNVLRQYFMARVSCPTPDYDQTVYKYHRSTDDLLLKWTIPSKHSCLLMLENRHRIKPEEYQLMNYVLKFKDGSLMVESMKENGEVLHPDAPGVLEGTEWKKLSLMS